MFFNEIKKIPSFIEKSGFSILSLKSEYDLHHFFEPKNSFILEPDENNKISVEKVRELFDLCSTHKTSAYYIVINHAETMNEQAENAILKLLEEPKENYHFVLFVNEPTELLPTILSRANIYIERVKDQQEKPVQAETDIKFYAKRIIAAKSSDLLSIYNDISKEKEFKKNSRLYLQKIIDAAIEIAYKSFFKTNKLQFIKRAESLITLQENLKRNGHLKLHFIADLC
jgi:DNA polymerase III delta prime subunit